MIYLLYTLIFVHGISHIRGQKDGFVIVLDTLENCEGFDNTYITFQNFKMFPNHTSTGNLEIVQDLPMPSTINLSIFRRTNKNWSKSPFSISDMDFCKTLEKDVWVISVIRTMINIPRSCPVKKGLVEVKSLTHRWRTNIRYMVGCRKVQFFLKHKKKTYSCIQAILKCVSSKDLDSVVCPKM